MAHIKEPEEIDFLIQSPPLTEKERKEISELIRNLKAKTKRTRAIRRKKTKKGISESKPNAQHAI